MPIYEYLCAKCSNLYEKREGFDAPAKQKCPKCRGKAQRVIQVAPIVFKGSGFYKTDSRKAPPSEPAAATASSSDSGSDSASTSTKASSSDSPSSNGATPDASSSKGGSSKDTAPATASSD